MRTTTPGPGTCTRSRAAAVRLARARPASATRRRIAPLPPMAVAGGREALGPLERQQVGGGRGHDHDRARLAISVEKDILLPGLQPGWEPDTYGSHQLYHRASSDRAKQLLPAAGFALAPPVALGDHHAPRINAPPLFVRCYTG